MDELIIRYLRGEATEFEVRQLEHWTAESKENERQFIETRRLWLMLDEMENPAVDPPPALTRVVETAERRRRRIRARETRRAALRSPWAGYGLAAAAVVTTLFLGVRGVRDEPLPESTLTPVESTSGSGNVMTMSLTDGSVVRLAPDARIEFPPASGRREVVLEGRAFFAVTESDTPFVVHTDLGEVSVHGTRFEVAAEESELRTIVLEGVVSVSGRAGSLRLEAGQIAYLGREGIPRMAESEDYWAMLDWPGGLLVFQETPLAQVAGEIGRHFGRTVRVADEEIGRLRITAWFQDEPLGEVVSAVCLIAGVRCGADGDELIFAR